ncbi:hypothetical protein GOP47_0016031 [Adiantum capillus-veneris]|uniref:Uncharacterized protein n=1 Tax=Adiantum capillus-veneris TaxID=13818 RepID=A0A9D4ZDS8_ADICA|nr:hypothetical protein GOP47_0016031 [Adiantum capillus-veneris]
MTIQLKIGWEQIQPLQGLSKEGQWASGHSNEDVYDATEHDELKPLQQQYTSLRDLIVVSPTKRGLVRGQDVEWCDVTELKFKDNLLKLAARAYLQPMGKQSTPEMHFIAQCWMTFMEKNKSLVAGIVESVQKQVDACVKFFRAQTFNMMQLFKPQQQIGTLQMRLS